jgi:hypothetical protein
MLNAVSLTITSGDIDRHLSINPVYFQASPDQAVVDTWTYLIYEEITPYEGMTDEDIFIHLDKTTQPDHDPGDDLLHLGAIVFTSSEHMAWRWEGRSPGFSGQEMEALINFITEYFEGTQESSLDSCDSNGFAFPLPPDTFTIHVHFDGQDQKCTVSNWGEIFEIEFSEGYILLKVDENLVWRQLEGVPLNKSLIDELGYKINSSYT